MIIEKKNSLDIDSSVESINATISESSLPFIFKLLSENFYSNQLGSMIREITSNCIDSHTEARVDKPVFLRREYSQEDKCYYIIFEDFGVGLSTDRIMSIFMDYGNSSKRTTNELVGGFGLGSKSPLSYQESFNIITRFNGTEYEYIYSRGELKPSIISLYGYRDEIIEGSYFDEDAGIDIPTEEVKKIPIGIPTELGNGTQIRVAIKTEDNYKVEDEIKRQLCYFNNIEFKGFTGLRNNYTIYELRHFLYRGDVDYNSHKMHIALGQVAYPINFNTIDMRDIYIPIALKFEIGELQVTPNREELIYTKKTVELIKERIKLAQEELSALANKQSNIDSIGEFISVCRVDEIPVRLVDEVVIKIDKKYLPSFSYVFTPVPEVKYISRYIYGPFFNYIGTVFDRTVQMPSNRNSETFNNIHYSYNQMIVPANEEQSPLDKYTIAYMREQGITNPALILFREVSKKTLGKDTFYQTIATNLSLPTVIKTNTRDANEYKKVIATRKIVGKFIGHLLKVSKEKALKFTDYIPSKEWVDEYKENNKIVRAKKLKVSEDLTTFNYVTISKYRYSNESSVMNYGQLKENKKTIVYCLHGLSTATEERSRIEKIINLLVDLRDCKKKERYLKQINDNIMFISISNTAFETLKSKGLIDNFIYYQDMFQLDLFKRLPQKIHLLKNYIALPLFVPNMYKTLSSYGEFYNEISKKLSGYVYNLGFDSTSNANSIDLSIYNLPYELKEDLFIRQAIECCAEVYKNKQSKISIDLLQAHPYANRRLTALIFLHSQIKRLKRNYYSIVHLKEIV